MPLTTAPWRSRYLRRRPPNVLHIAGGGLRPRVLFVREDGTSTRWSAFQRQGDPDPPPAIVAANVGRFWAANGTDGSVAFFTSDAPLTVTSVRDSLYRWDADALDGGRLTELAAPLAGARPDVGPAAISDDATTVYFVATGALAAGATGGQPNLFVWRQGEGLRHIATLDASNDRMLSALTWGRNGGRAARVTADGDRLLFSSYAKLDPAYDTVEESPEACGDAEVAGDRCRQIYLYDARSHDLRCLTCVAGSYGRGRRQSVRQRRPSPSGGEPRRRRASGSSPAICRLTGGGRSSRRPGRWSRRTRTTRSTSTSGWTAISPARASCG